MLAKASVQAQVPFPSSTGETNGIAVFWSGCMLGAVNYHDAYQQVSEKSHEDPPEDEGDNELEDDDDNDENDAASSGIDDLVIDNED